MWPLVYCRRIWIVFGTWLLGFPDQTFLSKQAFFMTWDDHEVINDFGPGYDERDYYPCEIVKTVFALTRFGGRDRYRRLMKRICAVKSMLIKVLFKNLMKRL